MAVSNGQLEEMAAAHELAIAQMRSRCEELQSELAERDGLLKSANAALQQTTLQLQSSAADSDGKLRSAMEVASSLRSLLDQKEAALRTSHSREKRQAEAIRQLDGKAKGLQAQLVEMKTAEARHEGQLASMRTQARRQEAKIAALEEAVSEGHVAMRRQAGAAAVRRGVHGRGVAGAAGRRGRRGRRGGGGGCRERLSSTYGVSAAGRRAGSGSGSGGFGGGGGFSGRGGAARGLLPAVGGGHSSRRSEEEAEWGSTRTGRGERSYAAGKDGDGDGDSDAVTHDDRGGESHRGNRSHGGGSPRRGRRGHAGGTAHHGLRTLLKRRRRPQRTSHHPPQPVPPHRPPQPQLSPA